MEVKQECRQLELDLWQAIQTAQQLPQGACLFDLLQELDKIIPDLPLERQLEVSSHAIADLASIIQTKSRYLLEDWNGGTALLLPEDALTGLVRQTLHLDLERLLESAAELTPKRQRVIQPGHTVSSIARVVEKQEILQMLATEIAPDRSMVTYDEAISKWDAMIAAQVATAQVTTVNVSMQTLAWELELTLGEIWLTLLLSDRDYKLEPTCTATYCPADRLLVKLVQ